MTVRKITGPYYPSQNPRVETGAVQFGDDWPGLFVRGDNAMLVAAAIDAVLENVRPEAIREIGQYTVILSELAEMIRFNVIVDR